MSDCDADARCQQRHPYTGERCDRDRGHRGMCIAADSLLIRAWGNPTR